MSTQQQAPDLTEEQRKEARRYSRIMKEVEENAPIYDVEYRLDTEDERDAVMKAHRMLSEDLDGTFNVPTNTTFDAKIAPEGESTVMIVVAAEAKRSAFEQSEATYLADPQGKHWLWCCKDFKTDETVPALPDAEDGQWEYEDLEIEMLR